MSVCEILREGSTVRVALGEKLSATEVPALQEALKGEIAAGARELVIDMTSTRLIDSTGIGLLIATNNSLAAAQGTVRVHHVTQDIFALLRSMRLIDRLHVTAAEKESPHG